MPSLLDYISNLFGGSQKPFNPSVKKQEDMMAVTDKDGYIKYVPAGQAQAPQQPQVLGASTQQSRPTPIPTPTLNPRTPNNMEDLIRSSANQYGLIPHQFSNLLGRESMGFNPDVLIGKLKSPVGATGISQFMPDTAKWWSKSHGKFDPNKPEEAVPAAAHYLKYLYDQFGSWPAVYAAYNWGEGNVRNALKQSGGDFKKAYGLMPTETKNYVPAVMAQDWNM